MEHDTNEDDRYDGDHSGAVEVSQADGSSPVESPGPDPWARGGVMSEPLGWWTPASERPGATGEDGETDAEPAEADVAPGPFWRRHPVLVFSVSIALVMTVGSLGSRWFGGGGDANAGEVAVDDGASPVFDDEIDELVPVAATSAVDEFSIGTISWSSVTGDPMSLPARVVGERGGLLVGSDESGLVTWVSDDGATWRRDVAVGRVELGGAEWIVDVVDGRRELHLADDEGVSVVPVADDEPRDGMTVGWQVRAESPSDVLVEAGGELFGLLDRREEVEWGTVLGGSPTSSYRIRVTAGEDEEVFRSTLFTASVTVDLTAERIDDRIVLADAAGDEVWSVEDIGGDDLLAPLRSRVTTGWHVWDGLRFAPIDAPWAPGDVVEIASLGDRILAVATVTTRSGARAWSSDDGRRWEPVELPALPSDGSPVPLSPGDGEAVVTISDGLLTTSWTTVDGRTFEQLADVPGIGHRSAGDFGWVAPDPRSSPIVRVSTDGAEWESVDVSEQLGYDAARWDGRLEAIAVGDEIIVTSTVGDVRIVLVGLVDDDGG